MNTKGRTRQPNEFRIHADHASCMLRTKMGLVECLVSLEDVPRLMELTWGIGSADRKLTRYSYHQPSKKDGHRLIAMHRFILGLERGDGIVVDHINRNGLDNRRENLRIVTPSINHYNRSSKSRSGLRGASFDPKCGTYTSQVTFEGRNRNLGRYKTAEEANAVTLAFLRQHGLIPD